MYNTKRIALVIAGLLIALASHARGEYATSKICNLGLLYYGANYRMHMTPEDLTPYVVHTYADGKQDWLFDGFLFLDFYDGATCHFCPASTVGRDARKTDWQKYLDAHFEPGRALDALNTTIENFKATLGEPAFKHRVVMTVPTPIPGQKDWGELNGRPLDFDNTADAVAACRWFIEQAKERFEAAGFNNLELSGIYWLDEQMDRNGDVAREVADVVHSNGLQYIWIPWFKAPMYNQWRELGFDIAYLQPNYFFIKKVSPDRLDEACALARQYGMALEYECDNPTYFENESDFLARMDRYTNAFKRNKVFKQSALAYYTGSQLLKDFVNNPTRENQRTMDRLAREMTKRRKKWNF